MKKVVAGAAVFICFFAVVAHFAVGRAAQAAARPELLLQLGHHAAVQTLAFSPDGKLLASGSGNGSGEHTMGELLLWNASTGELQRRLIVGRTEIQDVVFSPDSKLLLVGSRQSESPETDRPDQELRGQAQLWDVASGQVRCTLTGAAAQIGALAFAPSGKWIAGVSRDLMLWDAQTGKVLRRFAHSGDEGITSIAVAADGTSIASAGADDAVRLWDAQTGELKQTLRGKITGWRVNSVTFAPDMKTIVGLSGYRQGNDQVSELRAWDTQTGQLVWTKTVPSDDGVAVAFSPDGQTLTSVTERTLRSPDGRHSPTSKTEHSVSELRCWEPGSGTIKRTITCPDTSLLALAFAPDSKTIAVGCADWTIKLWNLQSTTDQPRQWGQPDSGEHVATVAFAPDGRWLVSGNAEAIFDQPGAVRLWDAHSGRLLRTILAHKVSVDAVRFLGDSHTIVSCSREGEGNQGAIKIWDAFNGKLLRAIPNYQSGWFNSSLAVTPGGLIAANAADGLLGVWKAQNGQLVRKVPGGGWVIQFTPQGDVVGLGAKDMTLWNVATGRVRRAIPLDTGLDTDQIAAAAISPDGKLLAAADRLWSIQTGKAVVRLKAWGEAFAFSPDSKILAVVAQDATTVQLWDIATRKIIGSLSGHRDKVEVIAYSPDGKSLVTGSSDFTLKVWNATSHQLRATCMILPPAQSGIVSREWIVYTPDGYYDGSLGCEKYIRWRMGGQLYPASQYKAQFHRPDLVRQAFNR